MSRQRVLSLFKTLQRTSQSVFRGDPRALTAARDKIRTEFEKNRGVRSETAVEELIQHGKDCDTVRSQRAYVCFFDVFSILILNPQVLRENVLQARLTDRGTYEVNVREDNLVENTPFRDDVTREEYREAVKKARAASKESGGGGGGCGGGGGKGS